MTARVARPTPGGGENLAARVAWFKIFLLRRNILSASFLSWFRRRDKGEESPDGKLETADRKWREQQRDRVASITAIIRLIISFEFTYHTPILCRE